jgi:hypothetical protein
VKSAVLKIQAGGTLVPGKHVYIERPEDAVLLTHLLEGEYVNVLTPRQMGKSSLMVRTVFALRERGLRTASVDLAAELGEAADAESYFAAWLGRLARELGLELDLATFRAAHPQDTAGQLLQRFFREQACAQAAANIVVFLDEIDSTLKFPFTDGLFTAIRGMYNERALEPAYQRVTFCLLGVATPNELIKDRRTTAYNVGTTLELRDFDLARDDLRPFIEQLSPDPRQGKAMLERVLYWTGGQPFLTAKLCAELKPSSASGPSAIDEYVESVFASLERCSNEVHFQQILRFVETRLTRGLETLDLYRKVLAGERVREQTTPAHMELKLSGLVTRDTEGHLAVRNRIYARLFDQKWVESIKPVQKLQQAQQRVRVARLAVAVVLMLAVALGYYGYQQRSTAQLFEQLAARKIDVSGDKTDGFRLRFPESTDDAMLAEVIDSLPEDMLILWVSLWKAEKVSLADPLSRLTGLQRLDLGLTNVSDLAPLKDLTQLRTLYIAGTRVTDLTPLQSLTNLQQLALDRTGVHDLSPIRGLTNLRALDISSTAIQDIASLSDLIKLEHLDISSNRAISDLSPLQGLTALKTLLLVGTGVRDLSPLSRLTE